MTGRQTAFALMLAGFGAMAVPAEAQVPEAGPPRLAAVLVSVEGYEAAIGPRRGTRSDLLKLERWLRDTAGWEPDRILVLADGGAPRPGAPGDRASTLLPTRANIEWGLDRWLKARLRPGDVVLVAFAGRGASRADGQALLPIDARGSDPLKTGFAPDAAVERILRDFRASAVVSWVDAPMIGGEAARGGDLLADRLTRWPGSSAWVATGGPGDIGLFGEGFRDALGREPRTVLATYAALAGDERSRGLGLRQRGGTPAGLSLYRARMKAAGAIRPRLLVQTGHAARITALAARPDGRTLISASEDSTIRLWKPNAAEAPLVRVLPHFLDGVGAMAATADGEVLAAGDGMGSVLAWDLLDPDGPPLSPASGQPHAAGIVTLAFLPHGGDGSPRRFVSLDREGHTESWEVAPSALRRVVENPLPKRVTHLAAATAIGGPAALLAASSDGQIRAYKSGSDRTGTSLPTPGGPITALHLSASGRWAAAGNRDGRVQVVDLKTGEVVFDAEHFGGRIEALRVGPDDRLAVGTESALHLVAWLHGKGATKLDGLDGHVAAVEFSEDGDWLGACTKAGDLGVWKLGDGAPPTRWAPPASRPVAGASALRFAPAGAPPSLCVGEADGGLTRLDLAAKTPWPRIPPNRGRVRRVAISPGGQFLLQITADEVGLLWDLKEGRSVRVLEGTWADGAFATDDRLAMVRGETEGGGLALVDRRTGRVDPNAKFDRPPSEDGEPAPEDADFARVAVSRDGRRVAAATRPGRTESAFVWEIAGGTPRRIDGHVGAIRAIDLSADGRTLMTAVEDGVARLWDVADLKAPNAPPIAEVSSPRIVEMTAACLSPDGSGRILAAGLTRARNESVIVVADRRPGAAVAYAEPTELGRVDGRILCVGISTDGRHLAAAGQDRRMRIWRARPEGGHVEIPVDAAPGVDAPRRMAHHSEQIHALVNWPVAGGPAFVTGSDDATMRLWAVSEDAQRGAKASLLGTIAAAPGERTADDPDPPTTWMAFTPDGVYDGSRDGDGLVTFLASEDDVRPLGQYVERLFLPLLTERLGRGVRPEAAFTQPPRLLIEAPDAPASGQGPVRVRVTLGDDTLRPDALRLYQNDVPVRQGVDFRPSGKPGEFVADVRLAPGENRLYAMAGRPGDVDARSPDLFLESDAAESPGKLHILALGVSKYRRNQLQFADRDAEDISRALADRSVGRGRVPGRKIVLSDAEVTEKRVETAFATLRAAVKDHPEDTVVVFLAGHTDLLPLSAGESRFCLLLPEFPFANTDPAVASARGTGVAAKVPTPPEGTYLAYSAIYRGMLGLDALKRLVIVDACQAEAVLGDPTVRRIEQFRALDRETRRARTAYFLASRLGEAAEEAQALEHGLLTYVLLRGLGQDGLKEAPPDVVAFRDHRNADRNNDGTITTRELRWYVDLAMPALADRLPGMLRGDKPAPVAPPEDGRATAADRATRFQADGVSFPLVPTPQPLADRR